MTTPLALIPFVADLSFAIGAIIGSWATALLLGRRKR